MKNILHALYSRLREQCPSFGPHSITRQILAPTNLPPLPNLEMRTLAFTAQPTAGGPTKWLLRVELIVRAQAGLSELADSPEDPVFDLVQEIGSALITQPDERGDGTFTTLGGLCQRCQVAGTIDVLNSNTNTTLCSATIPVEITVAVHPQYAVRKD